MKKLCLLTLLFICTMSAYSQNQLNTYLSPTTAYPDYPDNTANPLDMVTNNPPIIPKTGPCDALGAYKVGHNDDFEVRVSKDNVNWTDLFEYNTFVNSSSGDLQQVTRSSFVSFDYSGTVYVEIKCMQYADVTGKVLIRPQSRVIPQSIAGNVIKLTLTPPATPTNGVNFTNKLSVEINGNRYSNLQIFANDIKTYTIPPPSPTTIIYSPGVENIYDTALNAVAGKKIIIKAGAILKVPYTGPDYATANGKIVANNGDEIYIEGGGILNGGVIIENKHDVKIHGRGIIDLTNYPKQYSSDNPNPYAYTQPITIRLSQNITLDGITINDTQQLCVELTDSDGITINNLKMFSRALWGDGFHMKGTSNVTINDCYNRTSDDCISIYASRHASWDCDPTNPNDPQYPCNSLNVYQNRDALNIKVTNTLLYADNAHGLTIGWHGNRVPGNGRAIYNLNFDNIDILEHDQKWVQQNGTIHTEYDGAIGINCSDENTCNNFVFRNIRVEDFTSGSLLTVRVTPAGIGDAITDGKEVSDIHFENFSYNGSGEHKSLISGINCDRFVFGVHFENFRVNGTLITKLSDYKVGGQTWFDTNDYAYNITFQEANNYGENFASGLYTIQNFESGDYLQSALPYVTSTANIATDRVWYLEKIGGQYRIKTYNSAKTLTSSFIQTLPTAVCQGRYLTLDNNNTAQTNQEWKIVGNNLTGYTINSAYAKGYITYMGVTGTSVVSWSKREGDTYQKWYITPYTGTLPRPAAANPNQTTAKPADINADNRNGNTITVFPNPMKDHLNIHGLKDINKATIRLVDLKGSIVYNDQLAAEDSEIYVGNLTAGVYLVVIENNGSVLYSEKFVKN